MDGCRYRRNVEANGRRTRGRLAKEESYSDSATSDRCVGRRRGMRAARMDSDGEVRSDGEGVVDGRTGSEVWWWWSMRGEA